MTAEIKQYLSTKLMTTTSRELLDNALDLMKKRNFRHLPVTDENNKVIGIVSDRDLYRGLSYGYLHVSQVMTSHLKTVDIKSSLIDATALMIEHKISALLVKRDSDIVGIITTEDLLHLLLKFLKNDDSGPTLMEGLAHLFEDIGHSLKNPNYIA